KLLRRLERKHERNLPVLLRQPPPAVRTLLQEWKPRVGAIPEFVEELDTQPGGDHGSDDVAERVNPLIDARLGDRRRPIGISGRAVERQRLGPRKIRVGELKLACLWRVIENIG